MPDEKKKCVTRLLSDSPTQEDAFEHARVADAIAELITTERGAKCIGLNGSWGSGKSSVVELLRDRLQRLGHGSIDVFVFDAWAHQGDPLRRSFLEQLISRLTEMGWLKNPSHWKEKREELSKRLEVVHTTSEPVLTPLGGAFAASVLLVPLGFELLKYFADTHRHSIWLAIAGFSVVCLPFLVVAGAWLCWRPSWKPWTPSFWNTHRNPYSKRSLLALFLNKTQERTVSNAVRTPDPTSVEFQSSFGQLIEEALQNSERRLLIVVDNLDRVDTRDALTIWATLKTFFDFDARRGAPCFTRLWLLVPFDELAIKKLWATDHGGAPDFGQSFVDKTFQTIFRVSPPVLSDWQKFLNAQLGAAFPAHNPADFHRVYRIYDLCAVSGKEPPTPRDIKLFVNRVGAIHRQWQDDIPLPLQALYALLSKDDVKLAEKLALKGDQEILGNVPVDMVGADWRESLAAVHFNVPKRSALQVMLGGRIRNCIATGDGESLRQLASITGFTRVLEKQIEEYRGNWAGGETRSLAIAALNLSYLSDIDDSSWTMSWQLLRETATNVQEWDKFDGRVAAGLVEVIKSSPNSAIVDAVLKSASQSFPKEVDPTAVLTPNQIKPWLEGSAALLAFLKVDYTLAIEGNFTVATNALAYLRTIVVSAGDESLKGLGQFLRPTAEPSAVVDEISKLVAEGKFDDGLRSAIAILKTVDKPWPWGKLVAALAARLGTSGVLPVPEIRAVLETLTDFSETLEDAKKAIRDLTSTGHMSHQLHAGASDAQLTALCALPILRAATSGTPIPTSAPNSAAGSAIFDEILKQPAKRPAAVSRLAELIVRNKEVDLLYDVPAKVSGAEPFLQAIFRAIAGTQKGYENIPPNRVVNKADFLKTSLGVELFDKLIDESVTHANLAGELVNTAFASDRVGIYRAALRKAAEDVKFTAFLVEGLRSVDRPTWLSELSREGELLDLLIETNATGARTDLTSAFGEALFEHAQLLMDGKAKSERLKDAWPAIVDTLDKSFQLTTLKRLIEILDQSPKATDPLLELYGAQLAAGPVLAENEERLALLAFPRFLKRSSVAELAWVCTVLGKNSNFLTEVKPETRESLEIMIIEATDQPAMGEEVKKLIERLASLAGIDIEKLKEKRKATVPPPEPPEGSGEST